MASTLQFLGRFVQRGVGGLDRRISDSLRYALQRGAADNVAFNPTAYTGPAATALAAVTTLQITNGAGATGIDNAVVGGRAFRAVLPCTINGTSGVQLTWDGGSATVSTYSATGFNYVGSTATLLQSSTLAGPTANAAAAYTMMVVEGSFIASGSGTFGPRIATNTGTATAPILAAGAYVSLTEVPYVESV